MKRDANVTRRASKEVKTHHRPDRSAAEASQDEEGLVRI